MQVEQVDIKTPEYVSLQFQTAALGSRAAAFLIDTLILMAINLVIFFVLIYSLSASVFDLFYVTDFSSYLVAGTIIIIFLINWGYYFLLEYFAGGRTLGKKFLGLRVIQDNGHSITLLSSLIRNLLRIIDMLPASYLVGMIMIFFHSKHKRVGDIVAGTIVVHERGNKKKKKRTKLDSLLEEKGIYSTVPIVEEWAIRQLTAKDWKLIQTYASRFGSLQQRDRSDLTLKVSNLLFPKIGLDTSNKNFYELEGMLLALYVQMKEEWDYYL
ncbi:hypothetical protein BACCIP111883_04393 [Sutcliffiella rhizosphaerae]|uniref:RDD domain-containing protein n=1 Tax=Sutcliffiella rhizosphaerae TaxID=2880967 RepID=A0ABN8AKZ1_9BACI|nr:hypothetical protein BACCIP111883_04393 [Sutcliffiella rhizosphaerae]